MPGQVEEEEGEEGEEEAEQEKKGNLKIHIESLYEKLNYRYNVCMNIELQHRQI